MKQDKWKIIGQIAIALEVVLLIIMAVITKNEMWLGSALVAAFIVFCIFIREIVFIQCPECGKLLPRGCKLKQCPYCGHKLINVDTNK